jgi:RNA polymerase sigma-70 factor (ECF subfamily)
MSLNAKNDQFLVLLNQHKKIVYKICNAYCKDEEGRKDLAQEITVQLWKSFGKYNNQFKVTTWMYRIALNVAISFYRRERKNYEAASIPDEGVDIPDDAESGMEIEANIQQLHQFIDRLDELHKALMILYLDNNTYEEIADVLGITETNVATKISRIKQKLKQQFEMLNK